ncbi:MAG: hypothetical protein K1X57_02855 [Gemmataceae bacterium]|nr:hypothetical protein [Gemmataceae bacterium]
MVAVLTIPVASLLALIASGSRSLGIVRLILMLGLATPLPVIAVAWHALRWGRWTPLDSGLLPAAVIHCVAGLPWVTLIVLAGLRRVDQSVQEDALLHTSRLKRAFRVDLPLVGPYLVMSCMWLVIQVSTEIVITDLLQVRTLAEEVYTQAVAPTAGLAESAEQALGRSILGALVLPVAASLTSWISAPRLTRLLPMESVPAEPGHNGVGAIALAVFMVGVPWALLLARVSAGTVSEVIARAARENCWLLASSVGAAVMTGFVMSATAGMVMLVARSAGWLDCWKGRASLAASIAFLAAVPGPVVGIGVRQIIEVLLAAEDLWRGKFLQSLHYEGPSPIPVIMVWAARSLPLALAVWWPAVARLPRSFGDVTRLETGSFAAFVRHEVWPALGGPGGATVGLVAVFCLGEVSGSRMAATPGGQMIAHDIFSRLHYGITPDLAGLSLLLLAAVAVAACLLARITPGRQRPPRPTAPTSQPLR